MSPLFFRFFIERYLVRARPRRHEHGPFAKHSCRRAAVAGRSGAVAANDPRVALQQAQYERDGVQHRLDQLLRRLYGPKAERFDPNQPWLFTELAANAATPADQSAEPATENQADEAEKAKRKGHGRKPIPKDLPRRRLEHTLPEAQRLCPCCGL